jgi:hypothetical protein
MNPHRTRPLILWLAALAILWGVLRPSLNAFMASGAGKALVEGCIDAGRLLALENGHTEHLGADPAEHLAQAGPAAACIAANALLACADQPAAAFPEPDLPSTAVVDASHPSRAPPPLA